MHVCVCFVLLSVCLIAFLVCMSVSVFFSTFSPCLCCTVSFVCFLPFCLPICMIFVSFLLTFNIFYLFVTFFLFNLSYCCFACPSLLFVCLFVSLSVLNPFSNVILNICVCHAVFLFVFLFSLFVYFSVCLFVHLLSIRKAKVHSGQSQGIIRQNLSTIIPFNTALDMSKLQYTIIVFLHFIRVLF